VDKLKVFVKTRLLQSGKSQTLGFEITPRALSSFDPETSAWEAGDYTVRTGVSSSSIRPTGPFTLGRNIVVFKENVALLPI